MTRHSVSICSSVSSSVLNVKIYDGSKLAYLFTRSVLQSFDFLLFLFCCFLVTSCLHSRALSRPETSCLLSKCLILIPLPTPYACYTCMPFSTKEKLLHLVIPGISLFPAAADILEVSILETATRVPVIPGGDSSALFTLSALSRSLFSPCHCFLTLLAWRNFVVI